MVIVVAALPGRFFCGEWQNSKILHNVPIESPQSLAPAGGKPGMCPLPECSKLKTKGIYQILLRKIKMILTVLFYPDYCE
jgi:hypothetical protein